MFSVIIVIIIHSDCGGRDKCVAIRNPPKPALLVPTVVSPSQYGIYYSIMTSIMF